MATTDDFEIGTSNLNNTLENSAKVGEVLQHPEKGWKRYDDKSSKINYIGSGWEIYTENSSVYNSTLHHTHAISDYLSFKFFGSKIRIISAKDSNSSKININIDGDDYSIDNTSTTNNYCIIMFENLNLALGIHKVTITNIGLKHLQLDAIDINQEGSILDPNISDSKAEALLIINLTDGETKVFDVSTEEVEKFKSWYNTKTEYEEKPTYEFDKKVNSNISVEEDVVHDQITSYEIRKY